MSLAAALAAGLDPSDIGLRNWPAQLWWRIYARRFAPAGFNGTSHGNARFSPLAHEGNVVPTLYAGTTLEVALMETVLHDFPAPSTGHILTLSASNEPRRVASLRSTMQLQLADLSAIGLRRLGLQRPDVIDSAKDDYPLTRQLATWIYAHCPAAQGLAWTSRQDDRGTAVVLFEPRLAGGALEVQRQDEELTSGDHLATLTGLLDRLGASLALVP